LNKERVSFNEELKVAQLSELVADYCSIL